MSAPDARAIVAKLRDTVSRLATCDSGPHACSRCAVLAEADTYLAATAPPEPIVYEPPVPRVRTPQETGAAGAARSKVLRAVRATRAEAGRIGGQRSAAKRARVAT